ncbi:methyltransferase type 12 [Deinococcus aerius]|uniref:Methyltransferase type 12 n=1 Tax=Deinococcus aerius TaxID=200253 RepID=A0A2I9D7B4_9DEIO|nr:class I SAM-dependent methyltransferase [Deinococcus aerius]GBF06646.1 methyltransferase type 12 [Deinococcus aerius]
MSDLFAGTAPYYARYRPGYPDAVLGHLRAAFTLDGSGRLLDLGCGTGEVARPLHANFEEVVGLDVSPEMIAEAGRQSARAGIANIRWLCLPAEAISGELGHFRLVTLGNAFHWMRQDEVLGKAYDLLSSGGVAILGHPGGIWTGTDAWERAVRESLVRWLGPRRRTRTGPFMAEEGAERRALSRSRLVDVTAGEHRWSREVEVDTIVGELFSTSFASRALLGEHADAFEADVRRSLLALDPSGRFVQQLRTEYIFAYKR